MLHLHAMLEQAKVAQAKAYAPYSNFHVGSCIRSTENQFFSGCNYENASYSLCLCAEGSAIAAMITAGYQQILEMVIVGDSEKPCTPCGACRQRIREFALPETRIHMFGKGDKSLTMTLAELLPESFGPEFIK